MDIQINLRHADREKRDIPFAWKLGHKKPVRPGCFKRFFQKLFGLAKEDLPTFEIVVAVSKLNIPEDLICNKQALLYIEYGTELHPLQPDSRAIRMTAYEDNCPFRLLLDTAAITDYTGKERKTIEAELKIYKGTEVFGTLKSGELGALMPLQTIKQNICILFDQPIPDLRLAFFFDETILYEDEPVLTYDKSTPKKRIGKMVVDSTFHLKCINAVDLHFTLSLFEGVDALAGVLKTDLDHNTLPNVTFSELHPIEVPVYFDMTAWKKPKGNTQLTIECKCEHPHTTVVTSKQLAVHVDSRLTELNVAIDNQPLINNGNKAHYLPLIEFLPGDEMVSTYQLRLINTGDDESLENAGLQIASFKCSPEISTPGICLVDKEDREVKELVTLRGEHLDELSQEEGLFIPNGDEAFTTLTMFFDPSDIYDIKDISSNRNERGIPSSFYFNVKVVIAFDYRENTTGMPINKVEQKHFRAVVIQRIHLQPASDWLCVDYGSSAITALFNSRLIHLNAQKRSIIGNDKNYNQLLAGDTFEKDSEFLSSDIVLQNISGSDVSSLCSERPDGKPDRYSELAICLSPTSKMLTAYSNRQIPCLKMLMGNKLLPDNPHYRITYLRRNAKEEELESVDLNRVGNDPTSLLNVNNILKEAYHILFRYFILPELKDIRQVNKLVLTYPNTYSPTHLSLIRDIAAKAFPYVRTNENCLVCKSESDAVAAYYMYNWNRYHAKGANPHVEENILVYDMGAGTLDVSLIEKVATEDHIEMRIVGKLGSCKAGNYIDYVIASVVCEICRLRPSIIGTDINPMAVNLRAEMKQIVKDHIKPRLSDETVTNISFTIDNKVCQVARTQILEHPKFRQCIEACTEGMVNQLRHYMGVEKFQIDIVLMSGRSCKLMPLQTEIKESVKKVNACTACEYITLNDVKDGSTSVQDRQKVAVAEGAIVLADIYSKEDSSVRIVSRRLYANYGIAYCPAPGNWQYVELLNHTHLPLGDNNQERASDLTTIDDLGTARELLLVQTYLSVEETRKQLQDTDQKDYITIMSTYKKASYEGELRNGKSLSIGIVLTENNEVAIQLGRRRSKGQPPSGVDFKSQVIKSSFWPVMVSNE